MNAMWKKGLVIALVAAISFVSALGAVTYMAHRNADVRALVGNDDVFKQPVHLTGYEAAPAERTDFTYAADMAVHAVVHIKATTKVDTRMQRGGDIFDPFEFFFGNGGGFQQRTPQPRVGSGSGVIISTDGYIVTNNHVVENSDELEVTLNDNRKFPAKIIGTDPSTDIALIKIEAKDLKTLPFGDSEQLKVGEWVLAVGNPFNLNSTVTAGIVSAKGRGIMSGGSDRNKIESFIQTDAAVNPGNSGGALVNTRGELVGINTAIYSETGNFAGYSFAVPISIAGKVVSDLKQYGAVQRAVLGISIQNAEAAASQDKKVKELEGAYVAEFGQHSRPGGGRRHHGRQWRARPFVQRAAGADRQVPPRRQGEARRGSLRIEEDLHRGAAQFARQHGGGEEEWRCVGGTRSRLPRPQRRTKTRVRC